jgi:hypothetical protein
VGTGEFRPRKAQMSNGPEKDDRKPIGSGKFAQRAGWIFVAAAVPAAICVWKPELLKYLRFGLVPAWFVAIGAILIAWGKNRIETGNPDDMRIGQDTVSWVLAMAAATLALMDLLSKQ